MRVDLFQQLVLLCELLVLWCRFGTVAGTTSTEPCRPSHHQIESEEDGLWDAHSRETEQELLDRGGKLVEVCAICSTQVIRWYNMHDQAQGGT